MEKERKGLEDLKELKEKTFLPPIQKEFKVELLSEEELTDRSKVANERKETAQEYAEQEIKIRTTLRLYKSKVPNWEFLPRNDSVRMEIDRLQKRLEELISVDGEMGESKDFSKLVIEVRLTDEYQPAIKMLDRVVQEKRAWVPTREETKEAREKNNGKWPEGALIFPFGIWFQKLETPGARLLNKRLREMCKRALEDRIAKMSAAGSHNLAGLRRGRIIPGRYYLDSPWNKDNTTGKVRLESHTIIEIYDKNKGEKGTRPYLMMRVEDAFGGTSWMLEVRKPFPAFWFEMGKVLAKEDDRRLNEDEKEHIGHVIKVLNGIFSSWEKSQKKAEPVKVSTPEIIPAEMKLDRTVTAESGDEVEVFVKPKKTSSEPTAESTT